MENHIVIMAGGIGSRLWPMSTPEYPKQFVDVIGCGKSLIQLTVERFLPLCPIQHMWVVTSERYTDIVKEQLPELPESQILAEPEARNTAPCIAYACWKIKKEHPHANIVVTPSDALVINTTEFARCIAMALNKTADSNAIVTLGIKPSRPETGYGYIAAKVYTDASDMCEVEAFKEKPDKETAQKYVKAGNFFWNAGIFVWNVETITTAIRDYAPKIAEVMDRLEQALFTEREHEELKRLFPMCEKISIDYAVMEQAENIFVVPAEFGWSDLGSWGALHTLLPQDHNGNAKVGTQIERHNCRNCMVHTTEEKRVVLEGLENYIVTERKGQLLVCRMSEEQRIKEFSASKK